MTDARETLPDDGPSPELCVAILLLSIDPDSAASVMQTIDDAHLERVTAAMNKMRDSSVDRETVYGVLADVMQRMHRGRAALGHVDTRVESILVRAFGEAVGSSLSRGETGPISARRRFAVFEELSASDLASLLAKEHPQIAAVFLAHLDRAKAAAVLRHMPLARRPDLIYRVSTLDRTPQDLVQRVLDVMSQKVDNLGLTSTRVEPRAWIKAAAEILNKLGGEDRPILGAIRRVDREIAAAIRDEMFTFDDIASLDRKSMQRVLSRVDTKTLATAMKSASPAVEHSILNNLSKRAASMVIDERDLMGRTRLSVVMAARRKILALIREMVENDGLQIFADAEELV